MKKLIYIFTVFLLASCGGNDEDCNCGEQKYFRDAKHNVQTGVFTNETPWVKSGERTANGNYLCDQNGQVLHTSTIPNSQNSDGTYNVTQIKTVVECN